jgi:hypothetical protein
MRLSRLGYQVDLKPVDSLAPAAFSRTDAAPQEESEKAIPKLEASSVRPKRKRGRPCKCAERGIICRHQTSDEANLLIPHQALAGKFS